MSDVANPLSRASTRPHPVTQETENVEISTGKVWVMLPAYNEEAGISSLAHKICAMADREKLDYEVVVVDDGSADETAQIVSQLSFQLPITLVQHEVNMGLAAALRTCFGYALAHGRSGDKIVTLDADDTQPPALIPEMLSMIDQGYDVAIGSRYQNRSRTVGVPRKRLAMTWIAKWLFKIITPIKGVWDYTCGFRAYNFDKLKEASDFYGEEFVSEEGFSCMVDVLLKLRRFNPVMGEAPMLLRYDQKGGPSKMNVNSTAIHTLRLLVKRRFGK